MQLTRALGLLYISYKCTLDRPVAITQTPRCNCAAQQLIAQFSLSLVGPPLHRHIQPVAYPSHVPYETKGYMRLLNTRTLRFQQFDDPLKIDYAILSHVWSKDGEQSFRDVESIIAASSQSPSPQDPHAHVSEKIRQCCAHAWADGYNWIWIDSCCIDQASSAELSEAINSMYKWYASASQCYAYLHDVDDSDEPVAKPSKFRASIWFKRGWTLQELIAPSAVVFLTVNWNPIGTKNTLAAVLQEITGISEGILRGIESLDFVSVARRMSWASGRKTTRIEDEAYSLMGLFGIHMPAIYGEGSHAFARLQEEILKQFPDDTLFSWGRRLPLLVDETGVLDDTQSPPDDHGRLFAPSPSNFKDSTELLPISHDTLMRRLGKVEWSQNAPASYSITRYGVQSELPILSFHHLLWAPLPGTPQSALAQRFCQAQIKLGFLLCEDPLNNLIALILRPSSVYTSSSPSQKSLTDSLLVGSRSSDPDGSLPNYRLVAISQDVLDSLLRCGELSFALTHIPRGDPLVRPHPRLNVLPHPYPHPGQCIVFMPTRVTNAFKERGVEVTKSVMDLPPSESPWCPRRHVFTLVCGHSAFRVVVGFCEHCRPSLLSGPPSSCTDLLRVQVQSRRVPGDERGVPPPTPEDLWFAPHPDTSPPGNCLGHVANWRRARDGATCMEFILRGNSPGVLYAMRVTLTTPVSPLDLALALDIEVSEKRMPVSRGPGGRVGRRKQRADI